MSLITDLFKSGMILIFLVFLVFCSTTVRYSESSNWDYLYISHFSKYILERSKRSTCLFLARRNFGRFLCYVIVLAFPKIGPGLTFGLVVAGQLLTSMIMEHFQIMGTPHQPISIGRIAGMAMIVGGVVIMKKF